MSTPVVVMKFGGSSLAAEEQRHLARARVGERVAEGISVVVVVSAIGRRGEPYATDTLLSLLAAYPDCPARERDALLACGEAISAALFAAQLRAAGLAAVSLRGHQAGIVTDAHHQEASIREIRTGRLRHHLARGEIPVVAGFQGMTPDGEVTTLGRGGSDTTAIALGVALEAQRVEIYTDVEGVRTADPRHVPAAAAVGEVTFEEAAELTFKGARVLHPRAAELARVNGMAVVIRHTLTDAAGTWLVPGPAASLAGRDRCAVAVTSKTGIAQVRVAGGEFGARPERLEALLAAIAERDVTLDMIGIFAEQVAFTVEATCATTIREVLEGLALEGTIDEQCAKVTLVGGGIHGVPGVMHRIVRGLARAGIHVLQSVDSNMIVGVLVPAAQACAAVAAIHREFFEEE